MGQSHPERRNTDATASQLSSPSQSRSRNQRSDDDVPFSEAHPQIAAYLDEKISQEEQKLDGLFKKMDARPSLADIMEIYKEMKQNPNWNVLSDTMQALRENMEEMSKIIRLECREARR